jgi:carbonic anhydrase/acetyltransferase-like protein (isoleucine patch superfamily)
MSASPWPPFLGPRSPDLRDAAFVAPNATVLGRVTVGEGSSIWYQAVVRADLNAVVLGCWVNVQDGATIHGDPGQDLVIADCVTIGHRAVVHNRAIGAGSLIGMGALLLEGVTIGQGCIVGAGAVVTKDVADGTVVAGVPAQVRRLTTAAEQADLRHHALSYAQLAEQHRLLG